MEVSLPLWERGLKYSILVLHRLPVHVAPLVGAWIEMKIVCSAQYRKVVAPLVGAWIEIKLR